MKQEGHPVTEDQLDRVQTTLRQMFLTQLVLAAAAGIAFSVVGVVVGYVLGSDLNSFSPVAILGGVIVAAVMALGHLKTYRSELRRVSELRKRLRQVNCCMPVACRIQSRPNKRFEADRDSSFGSVDALN